MAGEYAAWISVSTLRQLSSFTDDTGIVVFAYLKALTKNPAFPAGAERIARVARRDLGTVEERVTELRRKGMVTSQWLGYQPDDSSRKTCISILILNTLHELGTSDKLQVALIRVLAFVDPDGNMTHGPTQIATYTGADVKHVQRMLRALERERLIEGGAVAPFLRRNR
jgi:predicted transcriptional regulator